MNAFQLLKQSLSFIFKNLKSAIILLLPTVFFGLIGAYIISTLPLNSEDAVPSVGQIFGIVICYLLFLLSMLTWTVNWQRLVVLNETPKFGIGLIYRSQIWRTLFAGFLLIGPIYLFIAIAALIIALPVALLSLLGKFGIILAGIVVFLAYLFLCAFLFRFYTLMTAAAVGDDLNITKMLRGTKGRTFVYFVFILFIFVLYILAVLPIAGSAMMMAQSTAMGMPVALSLGLVIYFLIIYLLIVFLSMTGMGIVYRDDVRGENNA